MDKEEIKREVDRIRHEAAIYGWNDRRNSEHERLLKMWENCAHFDSTGKYIKAPDL